MGMKEPTKPTKSKKQRMSPQEKKELYQRLNKIDAQNLRILNILESDDKFKIKGLVETVAEIKGDLTSLIVREKIYKAKAGTWGIFGGSAAAISIWAIKLVVEKNFF